MSGISSSNQSIFDSQLVIRITGMQYNIDGEEFVSGATDNQMLAWTGKALAVFRELEQEIVKNKSIDLSPQFCQNQLVALAEAGMLAYQSFFKQEEARDLLNVLLSDRAAGNKIPSPTFLTNKISFPWEALYEGDDHENAQAGMFWGMKYAPARSLNNRHPSKYVAEQSLHSDMLFCLHHQLRHARDEWPEIKRLVQRTEQCRFNRLVAQEERSPVGANWRTLGNKGLLVYLFNAEHNMLHFACHCRQQDAGSDALQVSIINEKHGDNAAEEPDKNDVREIQIETNTFTLAKGKFKNCQPLVFLNACQSAGGEDALRKEFNLPQKFIESDAAAVIATACPVPDLFAAAFARCFYQFFLHKPMTIGQALRATRLHFLNEHHNPLGLAYGLYSPAHYRVAQPPAAGGFN